MVLVTVTVTKVIIWIDAEVFACIDVLVSRENLYQSKWVFPFSNFSALLFQWVLYLIFGIIKALKEETMAQITKKALEASLKHLLLQKPLPKITIQDLTDDCGISRMTFYYHFKDIYDLVEWSCEEDAQKALGENRHYDSWEEGLLDIFKAVRENKPFILNVYHSVSREQIETYLYQLTYQLMIDVVEEKAVGLRVSTEDKDFIADFYKYALVGLMLDWIKKDMREDPQDLVNRLAILVHGNIVDALQHYDTKGR